MGVGSSSEALPRGLVSFWESETDRRRGSHRPLPGRLSRQPSSASVVVQRGSVHKATKEFEHIREKEEEEWMHQALQKQESLNRLPAVDQRKVDGVSREIALRGMMREKLVKELLSCEVALSNARSEQSRLCGLLEEQQGHWAEQEAVRGRELDERNEIIRGLEKKNEALEMTHLADVATRAKEEEKRAKYEASLKAHEAEMEAKLFDTSQVAATERERQWKEREQEWRVREGLLAESLRQDEEERGLAKQREVELIERLRQSEEARQQADVEWSHREANLLESLRVSEEKVEELRQQVRKVHHDLIGAERSIQRVAQRALRVDRAQQQSAAAGRSPAKSVNGR
jgi:hypothetical protein